MVPISEIYNTLPTLGEAGQTFVNREATFAAVAQLLERYDGKFNVCLIHAHCSLAKDEIMVATGNISEPTPLVRAVSVYTERWLPSGEAYEFTPELVTEFARLTSAAPVPGLHYVAGAAARATAAAPLVERTEGRRNIIEPLMRGEATGEYTETAWSLSSEDGVKTRGGCAIFCDTRVTRGLPHHKNTKSHLALP